MGIVDQQLLFCYGYYLPVFGKLNHYPGSEFGMAKRGWDRRPSP
jgi:hypothetical protein